MTDTSRQMGTQAESLFVECFKQHGHECTKSTRDQDMREHWDYLVDGKHKVEVKARKKARRHALRVDDDIVYVEFFNVRGDLGWLYGKADYLAFERPNGFLLVARIQLVDLAEHLTKHEWVDRPTLYKKYKRRDRPDECVGLLQIRDVLTLNHKLLEYK